jgi:RNA polymerase sigma-70 factor, ECF subfamily
MPLLAQDSPKESDNKLLLEIAKGDRAALEKLYLGHHRRLARFLSRFSQRYENIEEIINDTFMVVWQSAKDFRFASQVSTWIFGIAYHTALKSIRSHKNDASATSLEDCPEMYFNPSDLVEMEDWLSHGMNRLPPEQRLTLELAYHMGHSMDEIAAITNAPVGTVKARMFHAREKLRHYLPALDGSESDAG